MMNTTYSNPAEQGIMAAKRDAMVARQTQRTGYEFSIMKYPTGRFGYVGSVPVELCRENGSSIVLETEQQAWDAARAIGWEPAFAR